MSIAGVATASKGAPCILGGATLLFYLLNTSYQFSIGDGAAEVDLATRVEPPLRPYHLLQTPLYRGVIALWSLCGFDGPAVVPVHVLNIGLGSATVPLLWALCLRLGVSGGLAGFAAAFWASSHAVVEHSVSGETGMTPMPFLIGALILGIGSSSESSRAFVLRILAASSVFSVAVSLSLNTVLLLPALGAALIHGKPPVQRMRTLVFGVGSAVVLSVAPFVFAAAIEGHTSPEGFMRWMSRHPEAEGLRGIAGDPLQLPRAWVGVGRLMLPESDGETGLKGMLTSRPVKTTGADWLSLGRNVLFTTALIVLAARGFWMGWARLETTLLVMPIFATGAFCLSWLGSDPQFWLPVYPLLLVFAMIGLGPMVAGGSVRLLVLGAVLCGFLGVVNYQTEVPTALAPSGGPRWEEATRAAAVLSPGDLVLGPGGGALDWVGLTRRDVNVLVFTYQSENRLRDKRFLESLKSTIHDRLTRGGQVFIYGLHEPMRPGVVGSWEIL